MSLKKKINVLSSGVGAQLTTTGSDAAINELRRRKHISLDELNNLSEALLSPEFLGKVVHLFVKDYQAGVRLILDNFVWLVPRGIIEQYPQAFADLKRQFRQKLNQTLYQVLGGKKFQTVQIVPTQRSIFDDEQPENNETEAYLYGLFHQHLALEKDIWNREKFVAGQTFGSRSDILAYCESVFDHSDKHFAETIVPHFKFHYNFATGQTELMDGTSFIALLQHLQTEFGSIQFGLNCFPPSHYPLLLGELDLHPDTKQWFIANQVSVMPNLYDPTTAEEKTVKTTAGGGELWQSPKTYSYVMKKFILPTLAQSKHPEGYACGCCGSDNCTCKQDIRNIRRAVA